MSKNETVIRPLSQIKPTDSVRKMLVDWSLPEINTPGDLITLRKRLFSVKKIFSEKRKLKQYLLMPNDEKQMPAPNI